MSLYRYFQPSLPSPCGDLAGVVAPAAIKDANEAVKNAQAVERTSRGQYCKISPGKQASIARYALESGNKAAARFFSKELNITVKESSVSTWKKKYLTELREIKLKTGKTPEIERLPVKKRGRPLLLGEKLDQEVASYIKAVRGSGGVITTGITIAAATAIVRRADRNLLSENGGPITLTTNWAKSLLHRMKFVKRRGSSAAKITVTNFNEVKEQFLLDIKGVVRMEEIPNELVFNWDQTAISIVPGSSWTMELKGSKRIEIVGISDKRQITGVFCATLAGGFLPFQLIYQGKTTGCLPHFKFPVDWNVTFTPNHWSNEEKMLEYVEKVIVPYVQSKRKKLELPEDYPALAIYDAFKGQQTPELTSFLERNNIYAVNIPANCTDRLQPLDISVNKAAKEFMRAKFREWYAEQVQKQLDQGEQEFTPVDLKMSTMKPLGARWLVSLHDYISGHNSIILNGFKDIAKAVAP